jgi:molybdenum cofactor biosynthesis enzyme
MFEISLANVEVGVDEMKVAKGDAIYEADMEAALRAKTRCRLIERQSVMPLFIDVSYAFEGWLPCF